MATYLEIANEALGKAISISENRLKVCGQWVFERFTALRVLYQKTLQWIARYVRFNYYRALLWSRAFARYAWKRYFYNHRFGWLSLIYYSAIASLAITLYLMPLAQPPFDAAAFFTTVGAATLGALAIVFSISVIQIQTASQQTSAGLYRIISTDQVHAMIYWAVAIIAVVFFFAAAAADRLPLILQPFLVPASIIMIGAVLWLLHLLFQRVRMRINPFEVSNYIQSLIVQDIGRYERNIKLLTKYIQLRPDFDQSTPSNVVQASIMQRMGASWSRLNDWFNHLFDYHAKLTAGNDAAAALRILMTVHAGLSRYLDMMKGASVAYTVGLFAKTSNSQKFLEFSLEKIVTVGTQYMRRNDSNGIRYVIEILEELAVQAADIHFDPVQSPDNPIFEQFRFTLDQLKEETTKQRSLEGTFRLVQAYERLAMTVLQRDIPYQLDGIYRSLWDIAALSVTARGHEVTWGQVLEVYPKILAELVSRDRGAVMEIELRAMFESLVRILKFSSAAMTKIGFNQLFDYGMKINNLFSGFHQIIFHLTKRAEDSERRDHYQNTLLVMVDELYLQLRELVKAIQLTDTTLTREISDLSEIIGCLMIELNQDKHWHGTERERERQAISYLHLPEFLIPESGRIKREDNLNEVADAAAKIGICALVNGQDGIAKNTVSVVYRCADIALERGPLNGFTEPRIMVLACCIGILALKQGHQTVVDDLKKKIDDFDTKYDTKIFKDLPAGMEPTSPKRDQLFWEVVQLRDHRRGHSRMSQPDVLNMAEGQILRKISTEDIDAFTLTIWNKQVK